MLAWGNSILSLQRSGWGGSLLPPVDRKDGAVLNNEIDTVGSVNIGISGGGADAAGLAEDLLDAGSSLFKGDITGETFDVPTGCVSRDFGHTFRSPLQTSPNTVAHKFHYCNSEI